MEKKLVTRHGVSWKKALLKAKKALGVQEGKSDDDEKEDFLLDRASAMIGQDSDKRQKNLTVSEIIANMPVSGPGSTPLKQMLQEKFADETFGVLVLAWYPGWKETRGCL